MRHRERTLADVVRPAFRSEDQEPVQSRLFVHGPCETTRGIGHLRGIGNRFALRRDETPEASREVLREVELGSPPVTER